jgi:hypothetical protein
VECRAWASAAAHRNPTGEGIHTSLGNVQLQRDLGSVGKSTSMSCLLSELAAARAAVAADKRPSRAEASEAEDLISPSSLQEREREREREREGEREGEREKRGSSAGPSLCRNVKTTVGACKMASTCGLKKRKDSGISFSQLGGNEAPADFDALLPPGSLFRLKVAPCPPESLLGGLRMVSVQIRCRDMARTR